jgi:hypothetical protein
VRNNKADEFRKNADRELTTWTMFGGNLNGLTSHGTHSMAWQPQDIGDVNSDGTDDIMWREVSTGQMTSWLMENGLHTGDRDYGFHSLRWQEQALGDFNADGADDVLWRHLDTGEASSWLLTPKWPNVSESDFLVV